MESLITQCLEGIDLSLVYFYYVNIWWTIKLRDLKMKKINAKYTNNKYHKSIECKIVFSFINFPLVTLV